VFVIVTFLNIECIGFKCVLQLDVKYMVPPSSSPYVGQTVYGRD
jgi:hypothetical protein